VLESLRLLARRVAARDALDQLFGSGVPGLGSIVVVGFAVFDAIFVTVSASSPENDE
jgi:hypothetical protein